MRPGLKIQRGRHQDVRELLRAAGIPRWLRERLPAVMEGESVVMVPAVLPGSSIHSLGIVAPPRQAMQVGAFIDDDSHSS